jgi:hypothetical protein
VHVKGDVFRRMVVAGREEMSSTPSEEARAQLRLRYRLAALAADEYHDAGFAVVVQDVVVGPLLADFLASVRSRPLVAVALVPRPDVVAQREERRLKTAYRSGAVSISDLDTALRESTPKVGMWLDNSVQTPEETVEAIIHDGWQHGLVE